MQSGGNWLSFRERRRRVDYISFSWMIEVASQAGRTEGTYTGTVVIGSSVRTDTETVNITLADGSLTFRVP
jgi:hypothetical protein